LFQVAELQLLLWTFLVKVEDDVQAGNRGLEYSYMCVREGGKRSFFDIHSEKLWLLEHGKPNKTSKGYVWLAER